MFMLKKAFFDMWDNFLPIIIMNLGFILLLVVPILLPSVFIEFSVGLSLIPLLIGILLLFVYSGAVSLMIRDMTDYKSLSFSDFVKYLKETWKSSLVLGLIYSLHIFVLSIAFPVYAGMGNLLGLAALVFLFWASVIWLLSSQFFFPIRARLDASIKKIIKKCFIVFFDNTIFSLISGLGVVGIIILSGFTAFLIPGFAGALLFIHVGFKLRLYKYDYLEENPDADRKKIPWDALLVEDKDRVGKRTLRGMIFPWKE
jgi:uncharacterized membrane protein YesL